LHTNQHRILLGPSLLQMTASPSDCQQWRQSFVIFGGVELKCWRISRTWPSTIVWQYVPRTWLEKAP